MSILTLNNFPIPVASFEEGDDTPHYEGRHISGKRFRDRPVGTMRVWEVETPWVTLERARAIKGLVQGRGHVFPFDTSTGLYSTYGATLTGVVSTALSGGAGVFGDDFLDIAETVTVAPVLPGPWTIAYWYDPTSTQVHRLATSNGDEWEDQVAGSYAWTIALNGSNQLELTTSESEIDDLVMLPFVIPDDWATAWDTAEAFSLLPGLRAEGELFEEAQILVEGGQDVRITPGQGVIEGTYQRIAQVRFTLFEQEAPA